MKKIIFYGWQEGYLKISSTKLFQQHFGLNLMEAKQKTNALLDGQKFTLIMNNIEDVKEITDQSLSIGVLCRLEG